ncbi:hypothetical protein ACFOPX_04955 [Helicobacter baculiformis]|uniref:Uncharacterized protein n=1 Tax=Helicobacter baculiformis TaxID=427351 RepID=A0ABV7ZI68_9HELI|nr:hypothetical protein [Helicobacter baculiformis]
MQQLEQATELQTLTEGSYPLSPEDLAEFLAYGVPLEDVEPSTQQEQVSTTSNTPTLPDEPWLDGEDEV